jgi:hypothetical protein
LKRQRRSLFAVYSSGQSANLNQLCVGREEKDCPDSVLACMNLVIDRKTPGKLTGAYAA